MNSAGRYDRLIEQVTERIYEADPGLHDKYGEKGKAKCGEDNLHHMRHLETAYEIQNAEVFIDYALWLNGILVRHGMESRHLTENFRYISEALTLVEDLDVHVLHAYRHYLADAMTRLED